MSKNKCSLKYFDGEKFLYGTAAQLKMISDKGGYDNFIEALTKDISIKVTKEIVPIVYEEIKKDLQRPILKRVK